jgi:LysM repeat protein
MPDDTRQSSVRMLAPIALVLFAIAFFVVILSSGSDDEGGGKAEPAIQRTTAPKRGKAQAPSRRARDTYTVKTGDTLAGIAQKTGVPVEQLQALNPLLDPQALVSGQKIKLRE